MDMCKVLYLIVITLAVISCQNQTKSTSNVESAQIGFDSLVSAKTTEINLMTYWDDFDFRDFARIKSPQIGEQKFVDFLGELPTVPDSVVAKAIQSHLEKAEISSSSFQFYIKQYEHYLYDPNSPVRNEVYYASVLEYLLVSPKTDETSKIRYKMLLKIINQNNPGSKANNFRFLDAKGTIKELHKIVAEYKMLFFYDPTCHNCEGKIKDLANSKATNDLIDSDKLRIIAVSVHPERKLWEDNKQMIPESWINGFDVNRQVIGKGLYNVLAFPTILLLDRDNNVVLKDAPLDVTLRRLFELTGI